MLILEKKIYYFLLCIIQFITPNLLRIFSLLKRFIPISTHYLTQRQTNVRRVDTIETFYFNSLPHAEVDLNPVSIPLFMAYFNSLPHAEVDDAEYIRSNAMSAKFQLTTSRRGRPRACTNSYARTLEFQLTTSRRGRRLIFTHSIPLSLFQLTTSRRGRRFLLAHIYYSFFISTHYLTQRQTYSDLRPEYIGVHFNSLPHAEVDGHDEFKLVDCKIFQLTTSRRGRLEEHCLYDSFCVFQLTTSRRGRL